MPLEYNFVEIGHRVLLKRKEKKLTQSQLAKNGKFDPSMINQLEQGKIKVSDKYLERLAEFLEVSWDYLVFGSDVFKVGFGYSHTSSPLFLLIDESQIPEGFHFTYFFDNKGLALYSNEEQPVNDPAYQYHTAPWLVEAVGKGIIDMAFVPHGTYKFKIDHLMRLCSIMDTAKGGLKILICGQNEAINIPPAALPKKQKQGIDPNIGSITNISKEQERLDLRYKMKNSKKVKTCFLKDTVSEDYFNSTFLDAEYANVFEPFAIDSRQHLPELIKNIGDSMISFVEINDFSAFIGWEPHISSIRNYLKMANRGLKVMEMDQSDFAPYDEPFFHITVDCIIRTDKYPEYVKNDQVKNFLRKIKEAVAKLNELKNYKGAHYKIRNLQKYLHMEDFPNDVQNALYSTIHKINFEFNSDII